MKNLSNTAILTVLLFATALNAQAMGKNPEETLPQNPPAHVDSPVIPVSRETAERMLKLRTSPNMEAIIGKWLLTTEVKMTNRSDEVGRHQESGLRNTDHADRIETLEIQHAFISSFPERAQNQFFATVNFQKMSTAQQADLRGKPQIISMDDEHITFRYRYDALINLPGHSSSESMRSYAEHKLDAKAYCGISIKDSNVMICGRRYYNLNHGTTSGYVMDVRAYKRIAEGKNHEEAPPQNPPAHVDSPELPVSQETAMRMLKLQTAPNKEAFVGKWILTSEVIINKNDEAGRHKESGLNNADHTAGIETLEIRSPSIPNIPDNAQSQFFATFDFQSLSTKQREQLLKNAQTVSIEENHISFLGIDRTLIAMLGHNSTNKTLRYELANGLESESLILDLKFYCGVSSHNNNVMICSRKYFDPYGERNSINIRDVRIYKRIAEGK